MITRRGFMKVLGGGLASAVALGSYAFASTACALRWPATP